jgi:predicted dehydrogenase
MLGVGLIGCGQISELHAGAYARSNRARIVAIADKNLDAARLRATEQDLSERDVYQDYRDLLERDDVDLVEVLVPHHLHCEVALAALAAGKHVSLQKPMAISAGEAQRLVDAASTATSRFHVFDNFLFYPPIQRAKAIVDAGELGDILSIRLKSAAGYSPDSWPAPSEFWRLDEDKCGGGPMLFDDGHHKFAVAWHFLGMPARVNTFLQPTVLGPGVTLDCPAIVSWAYAAGAVGSFEVTWSPEMYVETEQYAQDDRIEITGTKGVLWVTRGHGKLLDVAPVVVRTGRTTVHHDDMATSWASSFDLATEHFLSSIETGSTALLSAEDARDVLSFALAAGESARIGRPVDLAPRSA